MNEFTLIDTYFKSLPNLRTDVLVGIGDDAACLKIPVGMNLVVSTDTLVVDVHFLSNWKAYDIAYKAVMVNISDLAAMAAEPCWLTLALTLPKADATWLKGFASGLKDALSPYNMALVGGDTTHGPLAMTLTVMGLVPQGQALLRSGAKPGDVILVSGQLGAAALAVSMLKQSSLKPKDSECLMEHLLHPQPRVDLRPFLRKYATAAIDISDGLSADLHHLCEASGVGASISKDKLPLHPLLPQYLGDQAVDLALTGGDDYELCFTVPKAQLKALEAELQQAGLVCYPIGFIEEQAGLRMQIDATHYQDLKPRGYVHF